MGSRGGRGWAGEEGRGGNATTFDGVGSCQRFGQAGRVQVVEFEGLGCQLSCRRTTVATASFGRRSFALLDPLPEPTHDSLHPSLQPMYRSELLTNAIPTGSPRKTVLLDYLGNPASPTVAAAPASTSMDIDEPSSASATLTAIADKVDKPKKVVEEESLAVLPEADIYVSLLVVLWLLDQGQFVKVRSGCCVGKAGLELICEVNRARNWQRR